MNFFEKQAEIKRDTYKYISLFVFNLVIFSVLLSAVISFVTCLVIAILTNYNPGFLNMVITIAIMIVVFIIAFSKIHQSKLRSLRGNGIAKMYGAKLLSEIPSCARYNLLQNVIEELSIAASLTVPEIYILEDETSVNAFVVGYTPSDAAIVVTQGTVNYLNRDQLQGVMGHELSHIINGDMSLNTRLISWIYPLTIIYSMSDNFYNKFMMKSSSSRSILGFIMVALFKVVSSRGMLNASVFKAGLNRKREYFADQQSIRLLRQKNGIAEALKIISCLESSSDIKNTELIFVNHMMFGDIAKIKSLSIHPPITDRIKAIDPSFDVKELEEMKKKWNIKTKEGNVTKCHEKTLFLNSDEIYEDIVNQTRNFVPAMPLSARKQSTSHLKDKTERVELTTLIDRIPDELRQLARNNDGSITLILSLLLSNENNIIEKQLDLINSSYGKDVTKNIKSIINKTSTLDPNLRLPLVQLCFPAIRNNMIGKINKLQDMITAVIHADDHINLFEYCLSHMLDVQINDYRYPDRCIMHGDNNLKDVEAEITTLFSVLSQFSTSPELAKNAYLSELTNATSNFKPVYKSYPSFQQALDASWPKLNSLSITQKKILIDSIENASINNNITQTTEQREIFRTICASIHVPIIVN